MNVDQFHGIEISEFPARIAEIAMWMMDHIMNNRLSLEFGQTYARIPLEKSPHIVHDDALETDWSGLLPSEDCSFVFGNPPFVGAKFQTAAQRAQVRRIAALGKTGGTLDYVTAWFIKAGQYVQSGNARIGFVATIRSRRASKSPNSGRSCSTAASWRSHSRTVRSRGVRTLAARRTCTSSYSASTNVTPCVQQGAFSSTQMSTESRRKAVIRCSRPTCSTPSD